MPTAEDLCVPVVDAMVLLRPAPAGGWALPRLADLDAGRDLDAGPLYRLGDWHGRSLWLVDGASGAGLTPLDWAAVTSQEDPELVRTLVRASQIARWRRTRRFCGACAGPLADVPGLTARRCPACGLIEFVAAKPVVIVAVVRSGATGPQVLLVRHTYGRDDLWSLVGGYVDPAETLEQAAAREVAEEVGLTITDLRYHASDGWGLTAPGILAVAFSARATDPTQLPIVDGQELAQARYFDLDALPEPLPPAGTVAASLLTRLRTAARHSTVE